MSSFPAISLPFATFGGVEFHEKGRCELWNTSIGASLALKGCRRGKRPRSGPFWVILSVRCPEI